MLTKLSQSISLLFDQRLHSCTVDTQSCHDDEAHRDHLAHADHEEIRRNTQRVLSRGLGYIIAHTMWSLKVLNSLKRVILPPAG